MAGTGWDMNPLFSNFETGFDIRVSVHRWYDFF